MEWEKVPNIPPLLVNDKLITEFEAKTNIFNEYFTSQYTKINNNSILPSTLNHLTDDKLSSFNISSEVIFQLIKNLDPNVMDMMKFLKNYLSYTLPQHTTHLIFSLRTVLHVENFLLFGKKSNIVPVHKKGDKQFIKNY